MKYAKIESLKNAVLAEIVQDTVNCSKMLEETAAEAERILSKLADYLDGDQLESLGMSLAYNGYIGINGISDKAIYESVLMALTELYKEGKRDRDWNNNIRYSFKKDVSKWNSVDVILAVSTSIAGCKLVTEEVLVPEQVVPAHTETKTVIKCD